MANPISPSRRGQQTAARPHLGPRQGVLTCLDTADQVRAIFDRQAIARVILAESIEAGNAVAWLAMPDEPGLVTLTHVLGDRSGLLRGLRVRSGLGLTGATLDSKAPMWVDDYFASPDITHEFDRQVSAAGIARLICAPVALGNGRHAVLGIGHASPGAFSSREVENAERLAAKASTAIGLADTASRMSHTAVLDERQRIAEKLHDSVGASLFSIRARLTQMRRRFGSDAEIAAALNAIESDAAQAADALRTSLASLAPPTVRNLSVELRAQCRAFEDRSGLRAHFVQLNDLGETGSDAGTVLAGVVREALLNVEKHAGARSVSVTVARTDQGIQVAITDDGVGLGRTVMPLDGGSSLHTGHRGIGITTIARNVGRIGGHFRIADNDDAGVTVMAWVPA